MSYYYPAHVELLTTATTNKAVPICFHERVEIVGVKIVDGAGIAEHAANYVTFEVLGNDKATSLFKWETKTGEQGALAANVSGDLVSQNESAKAIFDAGQTVIVKVTHAGSGKATDASICLQIRQARAY